MCTRVLTAVLLLLLGLTLPARAGVSQEEHQYHWELLSSYRAISIEVDQIVGFCTNYEDDIEQYMRENIHIFEVSYDSIVRNYETHNSRWGDGISSMWHEYREGSRRASDFIDKVIFEEGLTETELCDKLLWIKVTEFEDVADAMMTELDKRRTPYVEPMGLSRLWKTSTTNTWEDSVAKPYRNLWKLFDANPYKNGNRR